jgi:large subunit ribosomal protein L21
VKIFKMRRRKHYQKRQGHRQNYTRIEISRIDAPVMGSSEAAAA